MTTSFAEQTAAAPRGNVLSARNNADLPARFARSAATTRSIHLSLADFPGWFAQRRRVTDFQVERIPFDQLEGWSFAPDSGNLTHRSGRFFTIEGMHVSSDTDPGRNWYQPVIRQREVGILGILVKEFDGVLHFLMQAKMEPGNPNLLQLSPTVQATRSNYTKVHQGADVRYVDYFLNPRPGSVVTDVLQSEHGSWFFQKSNRNMIVEAFDDVPLHEDFCWLTLGQLWVLLAQDNLVNMDSRTVLSTAPSVSEDERALHSDTELLSWFTERRARRDLTAERIPLAGLPGWARTDTQISREDQAFFDVVAVKVTAGSREVTSWTQPLVEPIGRGICAFLTREIDGVRHLLVNALPEGGSQDTVELGPTVQYIPGNRERPLSEDRPQFLDQVLCAAPERFLFSAVHSEEGGRFLNAESDYLIVEAVEGEPGYDIDPPDGFRWITPSQLNSLLRHGNYVNVQARTLVACLNAVETRTSE